MQFITTFKRILKMAGVSFWRNRWLSLAATLIMILTLFTVSFFSCLLVMVNSTTNLLKNKADISVYFNESASNEQIYSIENALLARTDIKNVDYVSKEKALQIWQQRNSENIILRDSISSTDNPLPRSLEIKTVRLEDLDAVNSFLSSNDYRPLVKEISYRKNKDLVDRMIRFTTFVKYFGWILSITFVVISILIIFNTIRLTIFARSGEIEIMKLVGASDLYVQGPFVMEGILYGIIAAIFSSAILYLAFKLSLPAAARYLEVENVKSLVSNISFISIIFTQLVVGAALGTFCSVLAVKKHLNS